MMEDDPEFSVANHVFNHELPPGTSEADALSLIMRGYETPLNRARPLWDMHCYQAVEGGRTAIVWRVHHCLVDGVSGVELLKVMYDFRPDPEPVVAPETPWVPNPPSSGMARFIEGARAQLLATIEGAQAAAREMMSEPGVAAKNAQALASAARTMTELGDPANRADAVERGSRNRAARDRVDAPIVRRLSRDPAGLRRLGQRRRPDDSD